MFWIILLPSVNYHYSIYISGHIFKDLLTFLYIKSYKNTCLQLQYFLEFLGFHILALRSFFHSIYAMNHSHNSLKLISYSQFFFFSLFSLSDSTFFCSQLFLFYILNHHILHICFIQDPHSLFGLVLSGLHSVILYSIDLRFTFRN